jgi:myo-inositol-1(or 4)-monophosphatase
MNATRIVGSSPRRRALAAFSTLFVAAGGPVASSAFAPIHLQRHPATPSPTWEQPSRGLSMKTTRSDESSTAALQRPSLEECEALLQTAERAARAAGAIIRSNLGCSSASADDEEKCEIKFSIKDVVTKYDKQAQEAIQAIVSTKYPHHTFLGEEDVAAGGEASATALTNALSASDYLWICDPIDGTANFASGLPLCGVTMAVLYQGTPIVASIYDPHRDELFSTIQGQGAWMTTTTHVPENRTPLSVQTGITSIQDAIINAGCPADPNAFDASMRGVLALNSQARGIRVLACSALTLAWIASGRLTAHFGYDLSSWDLVAGAMLIREAGGCITDITGSPYEVETRNMLCSNHPQVHEKILDVLQKNDAVSFERVKK